MAIELKLPKINAETPDGKIQQMQSFLYQHIEELDWALGTLEKNPYEAIDKVAEENKQTTLGVMTQVNRLGKKTSAIAQDIDSIKAEVSVVSETVDKTVAKVGTLEIKADSITQKVSEVTTTLDSTTKKVGALEVRANAIEGSVSEISDTVDGTVERVGALEVTSDEVKMSVTTIESNMSKYQEDVADQFTSVIEDISNLQDQIDGSITTWFYGVVPTTSNVPAKDWTTTKLKNEHLGDLYYDTVTGYCYRWQLANNTYSWARITDTDVTKALEDASHAQDTADSKRRVFVSQPTPPYDIGDMWVQGTDGDIMRCSTARASGNYVATDWIKASKYTDDSRANEVDEWVKKQSFVRVTDDAITSKVSKSDYTGANIASLINQSADSVKILAKHLDIAGAVTFSTFDSSTQAYINGISSTASGASSAASMAQSTADGIANNIYVAGTTTINGGKIDTDTLLTKRISVSENGKLLFRADNNHSGLDKVQIGPFKVDYNSLYIGYYQGTKAPDVFISDGLDGNYTLAGHTDTNWVFGAGTKFGVLSNGTVYADELWLKRVDSSKNTRLQSPITAVQVSNTVTLEADQETGLIDLRDYLGGSGATTFNELSGRPKYNGTEMTSSTNIPAIPTNTNQLTNGAGFITGITKNMVTTALGYTPPATDTNTWRPLGTGANDAAAGNAVTRVYNSNNIGCSAEVYINATAMAASGGNSHVGMIYSATDNPVGKSAWYHVWSQNWSSTVNTSWVSQIAISSDDQNMYYRTNGGGAIAGKAWTRLAKASEIPNLSSLMGSSAIGSTSNPVYWDGSAWATSNTITGEGSIMKREAWWSYGTAHNANDISSGVVFAFEWHTNTATTGTLASFSCAGNDAYQLQLQGSYGSNTLHFRNRNGDKGTWGAWQQVATTATATTSANGLMTAAMVTKLNGIATGATAVNATTVSGWGFTGNKGTVTSVSVKVNGTTYGPVTSSGTIDLGTIGGGSSYNSSWTSYNLGLTAASKSATIVNAFNYNTLVIRGKTASSDSSQVLTIPLAMVTATGVTYMVQNDSRFLKITLSKSGNNVVCSYDAYNAGSGAVWDIAYLQK